ncbi:hypothetical protein RC88_14975 [Pectobacterium parvum]|nr:hypothetical protein RC88_14975 [Pectobacterium parvum]
MIISRYGQWQRQCEFVKVLFGYEVIIKIFVAARAFNPDIPGAQRSLKFAERTKFIILPVNTRRCNHHPAPAFRDKLG